MPRTNPTTDPSVEIAMNKSSFDRSDEASSVAKPRAKFPSRGSVLCIFDDSQLMVEIESAVTAEHYALLRARHGMHGFWLALNSNPDIIIMDISQPSGESNYLLDCLHRHQKSRQIPVIALINTEQTEVSLSCLKHATACINRNAPVEEIVELMPSLVAAGQNTITEIARSDDRASSVDAYFSELAHENMPSPKVMPKPAKPSELPAAVPHHVLGGSKPHAPVFSLPSESMAKQ